MTLNSDGIEDLYTSLAFSYAESVAGVEELALSTISTVYTSLLPPILGKQDVLNSLHRYKRKCVKLEDKISFLTLITDYVVAAIVSPILDLFQQDTLDRSKQNVLDKLAREWILLFQSILASFSFCKSKIEVMKATLQFLQRMTDYLESTNNRFAATFLSPVSQQCFWSFGLQSIDRKEAPVAPVKISLNCSKEKSQSETHPSVSFGPTNNDFTFPVTDSETGSQSPKTHNVSLDVNVKRLHVASLQLKSGLEQQISCTVDKEGIMFMITTKSGDCCKVDLGTRDISAIILSLEGETIMFIFLTVPGCVSVQDSINHLPDMNVPPLALLGEQNRRLVLFVKDLGIVESVALRNLTSEVFGKRQSCVKATVGKKLLNKSIDFERVMIGVGAAKKSSGEELKRYGDRVEAYQGPRKDHLDMSCPWKNREGNHSNYWTDPAQLISVQKSGGLIINQTRGDKSINQPGGTDAIPAKNFNFRKIFVDQSKKQINYLQAGEQSLSFHEDQTPRQTNVKYPDPDKERCEKIIQIKGAASPYDKVRKFKIPKAASCIKQTELNLEEPLKVAKVNMKKRFFANIDGEREILRNDPQCNKKSRSELDITSPNQGDDKVVCNAIESERNDRIETPLSMHNSSPLPTAKTALVKCMCNHSLYGKSPCTACTLTLTPSRATSHPGPIRTMLDVPVVLASNKEEFFKLNTESVHSRFPSDESLQIKYLEMKWEELNRALEKRKALDETEDLDPDIKESKRARINVVKHLANHPMDTNGAPVANIHSKGNGAETVTQSCNKTAEATSRSDQTRLCSQWFKQLAGPVAMEEVSKGTSISTEELKSDADSKLLVSESAVSNTETVRIDLTKTSVNCTCDDCTYVTKSHMERFKGNTWCKCHPCVLRRVQLKNEIAKPWELVPMKDYEGENYWLEPWVEDLFKNIKEKSNTVKQVSSMTGATYSQVYRNYKEWLIKQKDWLH